MEKLKPKLAAQGINPDRLQLAWISSTEGQAFRKLIVDMTLKLGELNAGEPPCRIQLAELLVLIRKP